MGIAEGSPLPAPGADVRERIFTMPERIRREAADGFAAEFALTVDGTGYGIAVTGGVCTITEGPPASPAARIDTDGPTWLALDDGRLTSIEAFLAGRVTVRGNVDLAVRMQTLFEPAARPRTAQDLEHVTVEAGSHHISGLLMGDGPPLVLLHGLGATKLSWLPLLPPLAERYRVLAVDLPGHGESTKPRGDYSPRSFARAVRRLLDAMGIERATLVGNSMGGRAALEVAVRSPERVDALVLMDPAVAGLPFPYYARLMRVLPTEVAMIPLPLRRRIVTAFIRTLFSDPSRLPSQAYLAGAEEFMRVYRSARARVALLASLRGLMMDPAEAFWESAARIAAPTLVLWGEEDRLVPARFGRRLAEAMPNARLMVLPGVGHVPQ